MPDDHSIINRLAALERRIRNGLTLAVLTVTGAVTVNGLLTTASNIVIATGKWIGLGASAGRLTFTDAAADTIAVNGADLLIDTTRYVGIGSAAGRFVFTDAATDTIVVTNAEFRISNGAVLASTYTPTLTNTTNIDASTAEASQYMQVGNVVTVSGRVAIDTTAAAGTVMGMSLPIASNIGNLRECAGVAAAAGFAYLIEIRGDAANDRATFAFTASGTANVAYYYTFTYQVI